MANYRKILLATDFSEFSGPVADRAMALAHGFGAELGLIHVFEPLPIFDSGYAELLPLELEFTEQIQARAQERMEELAGQLSIPKAMQWLEMGSPKAEIVRVADEQNVDLIVMGTHGRHGIGVLLGSTAAGVMHHASCDVLTVRLKNP